MKTVTKKGSIIGCVAACVLSAALGVGYILPNTSSVATADVAGTITPSGLFVNSPFTVTENQSLTVYKSHQYATDKDNNNSNAVPDEASKVTYTGLKVDLNAYSMATVETPMNATFTGDFKLSYVTLNSYNNGFTFFIVRDLDGNELFRVGRGHYQGINPRNGIAYFQRGDIATARENVSSTGDGDTKNDDGQTLKDAIIGDGYFTWKIGADYTGTVSQFPNMGSSTGNFSSKYSGVLPLGYYDKTISGTKYYFQEAGNLIFEYDESVDKLYAKVTFRCANSHEDTVVNDGGVIVDYAKVDLPIGEIDCSNGKNADVKAAFENGYTVSIGKDQTYRSSNVENLLLLSLNDVSLSTNVSYTESVTNDIQYVGEEKINGENVIKLPLGSELNNFAYRTITTKKLADNSQLGMPTVVEETVTPSQTFADKAKGTYSLTVEKNGLSKTYKVIVSPYVDATAIIDPSARMTASFSSTTQYTSYSKTEQKTYSGVLVNMQGDSVDSVAIKSTFVGDYKMEYIFSGDTCLGVFFFVVNDTNGNELFRVGRVTYQYNNMSNGMAYFQRGDVAMTRYNYWTTGDGVAKNIDGVAIEDAVIGDGYFTWDKNHTYTTAVDFPNESAATGNFPNKYQGVLPRSNAQNVNQSGNLIFDWDEAAQKLYIKVTFATQTTNSADKDFGTLTDMPIGEVDCSNGQNADVKAAFEKGGYTVTLARDTTKRDKWVSSVILLNINGADLSDGKLSAAESLVLEDRFGLNMTSGAYIRYGGDAASNGLRFEMTAKKETYETMMANVGENKYYSEVSYGMFIVPADYEMLYGELTQGNLFGANAVYGWNNETGKTQVLNLTANELGQFEDGTYFFQGSIVNIKEENIARDFVARGYIRYVVNGVETYKLLNYANGDKDNNTRSVYEVATKAVADEKVGADAKAWFQTNYIDKVAAYTVKYHKVAADLTVTTETVTVYGTIGCTVYAPLKTIDGYTFNATYAGSVLSATLAQSGTVLEYYFVANA